MESTKKIVMEYKINPEFILLIEKLKGKHKFDDLYDTGFQELTGNTYDYYPGINFGMKFSIEL